MLSLFAWNNSFGELFFFRNQFKPHRIENLIEEFQPREVVGCHPQVLEFLKRFPAIICLHLLACLESGYDFVNRFTTIEALLYLVFQPNNHALPVSDLLCVLRKKENRNVHSVNEICFKIFININAIWRKNTRNGVTRQKHLRSAFERVSQQIQGNFR